MMRSDPLRVGLLGYGLAGSVFHAPLISTTPGLRIEAIVTSDPRRKERAGHDFPAARVLDRPEDLWALGAELDLAVVAAPNRAHVPLALAAIDAGLAVVVDKPIAPTSEEGGRLVEAAERRGVPLTVFQNRRWDGDYLTIRRLIAEGALGTVLRFESRFERWRPALEGGWRESGDPSDAGGVLVDLGAHLVDQAVQLFGPVAHVYAETERRRPGAVIDDDAFVALTHRSGTRSHLWMTAVAAQLGPRVRVLGERAAYVKSGLDGQEAALASGRRPGMPGWGEEPRERWGRLGVDGELREVPTERGSYEAFYTLLEAALRHGSPLPVDPMDSVLALSVIEAAARSAASGATVEPGPFERPDTGTTAAG